MKKLALILIVSMLALAGYAQTFIHADTALINQDTLIYKWYHERFVDSDAPLEMISIVVLKKVYKTQDTAYTSPIIRIRKDLKSGDSLYVPGTQQYYSYAFVKNYIYTTGENMKRTLSLYHILNDYERLFY